MIFARLVVVLALGFVLVPAGYAQTPLSVEAYMELRQAFEDADARLASTPPRTDEFERATAEVAERIDALILYLSDWIDSGELSDAVRADAVSQRYVLFENLVELHADLGACEASHNAWLAMVALRGDARGDAALIESARRVSEGCVAWTPAPVPERDLTGSTSRTRPIGWGLVASGLAVGTGGVVAGLLASDSRARFESAARRQEREWSIERDARLRDYEQESTRRERTAWALSVAGGALVVAGVSAVISAPNERDSTLAFTGDGVRIRW